MTAKFNLAPVHKDTFQQLKNVHNEQLSEFKKYHIIGLKEKGYANRRIAHHLGRSDAVIRRCWQEWVDSVRFQLHDGSGQSRSTVHRKDRLIVRSAVTAPLSLSTTRRATRSQVSIMSFHRCLIWQNLRSYQTLRHLPLTPLQCRARLQWCLALSDCNQAYWGRI
ncbi:HTH_Tnp_Tc3_2 domain-containing protein [Trichonephila clavipes]|nr:HTH_Tnp_Tc3_2 domain-containing protein [Trichonephila clavipes]